jgi:hypothetical protein
MPPSVDDVGITWPFVHVKKKASHLKCEMQNGTVFSESAAGVLSMNDGAILFFLVLLYFVPSLLAGARDHHNSSAIFALNLFLGWTLLGWVVAFVWALIKPAPESKDSRNVPPAGDF